MPHTAKQDRERPAGSEARTLMSPTRMRLTIDMRFNASPLVAHDGDTVVTIEQLAASIRSPRRLHELLRGRRWDAARVVRDRRALNGIQAGALGLTSLARSSRFEVVTEDQTVVLGSAAMLARATATFATAFPAEVARVALAHRRATTTAARAYDLPRRPAGRSARSPTCAANRRCATSALTSEGRPRTPPA